VPKWRAPLIDEATRQAVLFPVKTTCRAEKAVLHAVGVMPDNVQDAASIPAIISLASAKQPLAGL
jgi:hypothetical protein